MKQVVSTLDVARLWVKQTQEHARNPNRSFYFHGDTIYSYGRHFPIARHVERKGREAILFTTQGCSKTTARHKQDVLYACSHLMVFKVYDVKNMKPGVTFKAYRKLLADTLVKWYRGRALKGKYRLDMKLIIQEANDFAEFFGLKSRLVMLMPSTDRYQG